MRFNFTYFVSICFAGYLGLIVYSLVKPDIHIPSYALGQIGAAAILTLILALNKDWKAFN